MLFILCNKFKLINMELLLLLLDVRMSSVQRAKVLAQNSNIAILKNEQQCESLAFRLKNKLHLMCCISVLGSRTVARLVFYFIVTVAISPSPSSSTTSMKQWPFSATERVVLYGTSALNHNHCLLFLLTWQKHQIGSIAVIRIVHELLLIHSNNQCKQFIQYSTVQT